MFGTLAVGLMPAAAWASDISTVLPAALDQPQVNVAVSAGPSDDPYEFLGFFNISGYLDTGASGVLLSQETYQALEIAEAQYNGQNVVFSDIGVGGSDNFWVSNNVYLHAAPFSGAANENVDNLATWRDVYRQSYGPVRMQLNQNPAANSISVLDVFGMPLLKNKVMVSDCRPLNDFIGGRATDEFQMRSYIYNPGTPYNPATDASDPGILPTNRTIRLSKVSFNRFTQTTPNGALGPTLEDNPFIGPNPFQVGRKDPTPPVRIKYGNKASEGAWLLDTGAAASIISRQQAGNLGITYAPGTYGTDTAQLLINGVPVPDQYKFTITGVGGDLPLAGFYLDSVLLRTTQGDRRNDDDPNHIRFLGAPVLVGDITVADPLNGSTFTLDGIFGMNFLAASADIDPNNPENPFGALTEGAFDWFVFDDASRELRVQLRTGFGSVVPEPASVSLLLGAGALLRRRVRVR